MDSTFKKTDLHPFSRVIREIEEREPEEEVEDSPAEPKTVKFAAEEEFDMKKPIAFNYAENGFGKLVRQQELATQDDCEELGGPQSHRQKMTESGLQTDQEKQAEHQISLSEYKPTQLAMFREMAMSEVKDAVQFKENNADTLNSPLRTNHAEDQKALLSSSGGPQLLTLLPRNAESSEEEEPDAIEEQQQIGTEEFTSLVTDFESGRFDEKFKRIFDIDQTHDTSDDESDFGGLDCFEESEEEKRENRLKLKALMVETLLMKYKIYLPHDNLSLLHNHVTQIMNILTDGANQYLPMALANFVKFIFELVLASDPRKQPASSDNRPPQSSDLQIKGDFPRLREWFSQQQKPKLEMDLLRTTSVPIQEIQGLDFWKYLFDDFKFGQFVVMKRQDALI